MNFFADPSVLPYSIALCLMMGLFLMEVVVASIGASLHFDVDHGHDFAADTILGWFHFGRLPTLLVLIIFLGSFGFGGMMASFAVKSLWLSLPLALAAALFGTRYLGLFLAKIMPRDETNAVSTDNFVGQAATIVQGVATKERKAEARLVDAYGVSHHFLALSLDEDMPEGTDVLILSKEDGYFVVVKA